MHYKEFATRMREQMPNTLSNMDDRAIADLAIKRKPQYAGLITFDEPVVEQPQQVNTQPVSSGNPLLDIWNDPNKSVQDFLNANNAEMEYQKKLSDPNYIAQEDAKRRLAELDQWKKEHPVLSVADDLANITSPFQAEWELRAKYGNNAPLEEVLKTKGKQAFLGGTGVASTALPAGAFIKTAKIASIANKASKAKKLNDAFKSGKYGAAFVGVPSASENIEKVIDGEQNIGDALANTAKDTVLGAAGGALGYGLSGLTTKGILNKVEADVANKYFSKAIKGGNQLSDPRTLEALQKQAVKKLMDSHKGAAIKTADGLVAGLGDAAVIGSADYGLNKLQGKQQESYVDHMKPYVAFGAGAGLLPGAFHYLGKPVEKALKSDVIKGAISKNEFMSNLVGEGANAFGVKTDIPRAKQYQELGEKVKDYDMPAAKHYTSKEMAEADSTKNLSPKERRIYLNYLKNGFTKEEAMAKATSQSNSKFDEMHAKAEQEQKQDFTENIFGTKQEERPTVKNQLVPVDTSKKQIVPVDNVDTSVQKSKEHVAEPTNPVKEQRDINTPTDTQTHVNEPASHVKTKKIIPNKVIDNDTSNYKVIKLEPGQAEGADTPYKSNNKMTKQGYENNLWKEEPVSTTEYVTDDEEFIKWYQQYKNSSDEQKDVLLAQKLKTFKNNEEQYDFYKKFNEQEEKNLELARKNYKSEESYNNVINKKSMTQRKPHTDQPDELGRYVKVVKENNIDITPKKEIEISESDMQKADALLRGILPANMKRKGWSNDEILDRLFKTYSHSEKGAQSVYDRLAKKLQLIKGDTNLKTALYKKLNDAAERYMEKTGKKITHKTKGLNANSSRANAVLSKIEEALEKGDLDIARNYIDNNKKLLKSTGNFKGNAIIDKAYTAFTNKGIKDVNSLLNNGDFQKAEELWTRIKPLVKTTYTDHSIKKMYKNVEGKKVDIGDTHTEGSAVNPSAEFERIEKEIEAKIIKVKNKSMAKEFFKTNVLPKELENVTMSFEDLSDIDVFKPFINELNGKGVKINFQKDLIWGSGYGGYTHNYKNVYIKDKDAVAHELQHAIDNIFIDNNSNNEDFLILQKAAAQANKERREYYNKYKDILEKAENCKKEDLGEVENAIVRTYKEYYDEYMNDILEQRARRAEANGQPLKATIQEYIEWHKSMPGRWERIKELAGQWDKQGTVSKDVQLGRLHTKRNNGNEQKTGRRQKPKRLDKRIIKDLHKVSVDIEQKRIKRGLITPEQAENRKKQLKSKYYIPMKTGNAPIEDTLDLTRNYNEGRETKVGLYGKGGKWKEHITPEKAVENLHIASVKTNFVDEIADYVEKNFAKPLNKNGTHDEDWVAVNAHLLWNGLAAKQSRSWYNLIDSGEDAIRKAFKNKEQADAFVELHNRTRNKDFQIPKQVFKKLLSGEGETAKEAFERYGLFNRHSIGKHVAALTDAFTDQFKRTVLGTSSFWVNNRFSNHLLLAANSENPARHIIDLYMAGKIKAKDMPQELLENSILEAVSQSTKRKTFSGYNTFDNIVNLFGGHTIDTKTLKGIKKATASVANVVIGYPNKVYNTIAEKLLNFNSKFENYERKVALLQQLRANEKDLVRKTGQQMLTVEEALKYLDKHPEMRSTIVKQVENVLGDYNNFTATEKQIIKRLIPFYSWFRTVARNTVHLAKKNPARFALIQYELHKLKEEDKDLKEWQRGAFRLPVKDKRSGKQLLVNKVNQIPWETLNKIVQDENGNFNPNPLRILMSDEVINSANPLAKVPLEGIAGKKFFGSGEITNKRYVSTFAGKNADGSNRYKYFDTKTKKEIDKLPASTRAAYVSKELGKNFVPLLSNRLIGGESLLQGYDNYKKTGKFLEPDKLYDADFGGFHHGDVVGSKLKKNGGYKTFKRFATNNTSEEIKLLNRLGLTLQPKQDLSQADLAKLERATQKYKKKRKAS